MICAESKKVAEDVITKVLDTPNNCKELELICAVAGFRVVEKTGRVRNGYPPASKLLFENGAKASVACVASNASWGARRKMRIFTNSDEGFLQAREGNRMGVLPLEAVALFKEGTERKANAGEVGNEFGQLVGATHQAADLF